MFKNYVEDAIKTWRTFLMSWPFSANTPASKQLRLYATVLTRQFTLGGLRESRRYRKSFNEGEITWLLSDLREDLPNPQQKGTGNNQAARVKELKSKHVAHEFNHDHRFRRDDENQRSAVGDD